MRHSAPNRARSATTEAASSQKARRTSKISQLHRLVASRSAPCILVASRLLAAPPAISRLRVRFSAPQGATVRQTAFAAPPLKLPVPKKREKLHETSKISQRHRLVASRASRSATCNLAASRLLAAPPRLAASQRQSIWSPPAQSVQSSAFGCGGRKFGDPVALTPAFSQRRRPYPWAPDSGCLIICYASPFESSRRPTLTKQQVRRRGQQGLEIDDGMPQIKGSIPSVADGLQRSQVRHCLPTRPELRNVAQFRRH